MNKNSEKVLTLMCETGLTNQELATLMSVPVKMVNGWANGTIPADSATLMGLALIVLNKKRIFPRD